MWFNFRVKNTDKTNIVTIVYRDVIYNHRTILHIKSNTINDRFITDTNKIVTTVIILFKNDISLNTLNQCLIIIDFVTFLLDELKDIKQGSLNNPSTLSVFQRLYLLKLATSKISLF